MESGHWISYVLLLGLIAGELRRDHEPGAGHGNVGKPTGPCCRPLRFGLRCRFDRVGRPGFYRYGIRAERPVLVPAIMGSPLYGTVFGTMACRTRRPTPSWRSERVAIGACFWIVIDSAVALLLFLATLATFDRCLGRVSETADTSAPRSGKRKRRDRLILIWMNGLPRVPSRSR